MLDVAVACLQVEGGRHDEPPAEAHRGEVLEVVVLPEEPVVVRRRVMQDLGARDSFVRLTNHPAELKLGQLVLGEVGPSRPVPREVHQVLLWEEEVHGCWGELGLVPAADAHGALPVVIVQEVVAGLRPARPKLQASATSRRLRNSTARHLEEGDVQEGRQRVVLRHGLVILVEAQAAPAGLQVEEMSLEAVRRRQEQLVVIEVQEPVYGLGRALRSPDSTTDAMGYIEELAAHTVVGEGREAAPAPEGRPLGLELRPVEGEAEEVRGVDLLGLADRVHVPGRVVEVEEEVGNANEAVPLKPNQELVLDVPQRRDHAGAHATFRDQGPQLPPAAEQVRRVSRAMCLRSGSTRGGRVQAGQRSAGVRSHRRGVSSGVFPAGLGAPAVPLVLLPAGPLTILGAEEGALAAAAD
mmetsp:Transcript_29305/g.92474  ORF Transcript_29305/g.92474 Transcript_29305/m.92474 type:complete len:411 (+) Transcript_29305:1026-2258(+)